MEHHNSAKRNYTLLILISLFRFLGDSYFYSFLVRYIKELGFSDLRLGILSALIPFMAIIGNLVLSYLATTFRKRQVIFIVWTLVEASFIIAFGFNQNFWYVLCLDIICNFCSNAFYNNWDTFIIPISQKDNKTYASGRFFGSLAYIIGVFSGGYVLNAINYKYTFVIAGSLMLLAGVLFLFLKFDPEDTKKIDQEEDKGGVPPTYKELFQNKEYVKYMIFASLFIGMVWATDNAFNLYSGVGALNVSNSEFSLSYGSAIVAEGVILLLCSRFKTAKAFKTCLFIGLGSLLVRQIILAIPNLPYQVYLSIEVIRGVSYGMILVANLNSLQRILGVRLMYKGFFLEIVFDELLAAVCDLVTPYIITATSYSLVFGIFAAIVVISGIMLSLTDIHDPQPETAQPDQEKSLKSSSD
jgi:hypothetical protein